MKRLFGILVVLTLAVSAWGETFVAVVQRVSDGDTAVCVVSAGESRGTKLKVRFAGIDAPEVAHGPKAGQPCGDEAAEFVRERIEGAEVRLDVVDVDRHYGRVVALVYRAGECVNVAVVRAGLAEVYREYQSKLPPDVRQELAAAEKEARRDRRNIWALANYERPSEFRRAK